MTATPTIRERWRSVLDAFATPSALALLVLGFGCGLPFLLIGWTLSTWLREAGLALGAIGLISYATLTYTLKFLWAPLVDRWRLPVLAGLLGQRRAWLMLAQLLLLGALIGMALTDPGQALGRFMVFLALAAFAGATQDVVVDAYRIEIAPVEAQGALAATYTLGYRLALLASGAGVLFLADWSNWQTAYLAAAALLAVPITATLFVSEPQRVVPRAKDFREALILGVVNPFREFLSRSGPAIAIALLLFVGLYKLPDQALGVITGPFYLDTGFDKSEIASVSKFYGVIVSILGAFLGGAAVAMFGLKRPLWWAAIAIALSNLLFLVMASFPGQLWTFVLALSGDNLAWGFGGTVLIAFMSSLTSRLHTATQYALLGSFANLPGKLLGGMSGFVVEAHGYSAFFLISALSIVPALWLLHWLSRRLELDASPSPVAGP